MTAIPSACKQTPAGLHVAAAGAATADGRVMTLARYLLDSLRSLWLSPYPAASLNPDACCINAGKASTQGLLASSCPAASSSQGPAPGKPPPPSGPLDIPTPLPRQRSQRSQRAAAADPDAGADGRQAAALGLEGRCGAGWPHQGVQAAAAAAAGEAAAAAPEGEDNRAVAQVLARMQQLLQVTSLLEVKVSEQQQRLCSWRLGLRNLGACVLWSTPGRTLGDSSSPAWPSATHAAVLLLVPLVEKHSPVSPPAAYAHVLPPLVTLTNRRCAQRRARQHSCCAAQTPTSALYRSSHLRWAPKWRASAAARTCVGPATRGSTGPRACARRSRCACCRAPAAAPSP